MWSVVKHLETHGERSHTAWQSQEAESRSLVQASLPGGIFIPRGPEALQTGPAPQGVHHLPQPVDQWGPSLQHIDLLGTFAQTTAGSEASVMDF